MPSLLEWLEEVPEPRRGPALRDQLSAVPAFLVLAKVAGKQDGRHTETFAKTWPPKEWKLLSCPFKRRTQRDEAPSDTTFQRALACVEPSALERVEQRWGTPRWRRPQALAGDGKRIRGANRLSPADDHWETVSLVDHRSGLPVASRSYREEGGELAAMRGLFEEVVLLGIPVTLDAGHTSRETILALQEQPGADTLATIQGNAGLTYNLIARDGNWAGPEARRAAERWTPGPGRWERRELVPTAAVRDAWLPWPGVRQVFRVTHRTQETPQVQVTTEGLDGFPSLSPEQAPRRRLQWHRGHWTVENRNHLPRDVSLGEDRGPSGRGTGRRTTRRGTTWRWPCWCGAGAGRRCRRRNRTSAPAGTKRWKPCKPSRKRGGQPGGSAGAPAVAGVRLPGLSPGLGGPPRPGNRL